MYFYPTPTDLVDSQFVMDTKSPYFTLLNYKPSEKNKLLFSHLLKEGYLEDIQGHHCDASLLIGDSQLQKMIHDKDKTWSKYVPSEIANYIKENGLFI